jgi:protein O-mannosyl-transferase
MAMVALTALLVYANSLRGPLLYDDVNAIRNNTLVIEGDVGGILSTPSWWADGRGRTWRPLTTLTFALDHAIHGLDPFGFHLVNVALHALVSVLVLSVFAVAAAARRTALAAALLFAVHPIHTEVVANVVGRAEMLAAAGFFLAWRFWLAADAAAGARGAAAAWTAAAAVAYFLATLGKENAVALPAVLVFADVLRRRDRPLATVLRERAPRYAVLVAVAVAFVGMRSAVIGQLTPSADLLDNPLGTLALLPRLLTAVKVIGLYALRLVFPLWLSADYSFDQVPAVTTSLDPGFLGGVAAIVVAVGLGVWAWRRLPALALGIGVFVLTFALVSNLFFSIGTIMGERLMYLPSAGFCLAIAAGLAGLAGERDPESGRVSTRWPLAFVVPLALVLLLCGARTVGRNAVWREPIGFFQTMTMDAPRSARSYRELGGVLAEVGRFDEARQAFERSLAIKPEDANTLYNYGNALSAEGRYDAAADAYRRAVARNPTFVQALENLGNAESLRGDQQAALVALRGALAITPNSPYLLMNIANTLFRAGSTAEARTTYEQALALAPTAADILTNYGTFLFAQRDFAAATRTFERIPPPAPPRALVALAACYRQLGRAVDAEATRATAERLYPRDPGVRQMVEFMRGAAP